MPVICIFNSNSNLTNHSHIIIYHIFMPVICIFNSKSNLTNHSHIIP